VKNTKLYKYSLVFLLSTLSFTLVSCSETKEEKRIKMKAFVENKCTMCHFSKRIFEKERTPEEWNTIVNRMRSKNPSHISPEEASNIMGYLQDTMGKEND